MQGTPLLKALHSAKATGPGCPLGRLDPAALPEEAREIDDIVPGTGCEHRCFFQ